MSDTAHIDFSGTGVASRPGGDRPVDDWAPKRRMTLVAARQHSRRVRLFQTLLAVAAVVLVLVLLREFIIRPQPNFDEPEDSQTVTMLGPRYTGRTSDGLPYTLTAISAIRQRATPDEVALAEPLLNFYRVKGVEPSTVDALTGTYNDVLQVLELRSEVVLNTDDGNRCTTSHARIFLKTKRIEGNEAIRCVGEFGVVEGNAYSIEDDYRTFIFKDGMSGMLEPDDATDSATDSATKQVSGVEDEG